MVRPFNFNDTFEDLQAMKRQNIRDIDPNLDYRESSLLYNATVVNSIETMQMLQTIRYGVDLTFADTAPREYLIRRAAERGIYPLPATNALRRGTFNIDVPIGSRYSLGDYNYIVTERTAFGSFILQCETAGNVGNIDFGNLIPVEYINGLSTAVLGDVLVPGEDEEETEVLRQRYLRSFSSVAFGGNRADYKEKVNALPGVGGTRVIRAWNGGGTVQLIIIDSSYNVPTPTLVSQVQEAVDPIGMQGEGVGIAPIDHVVTVTAVGELDIDVTLSITYQSGYTWDDIRGQVIPIIEEYIRELNMQWAESQDDNSTTVVRIIQIESRLLNVQGILDLNGTLLNGLPQNVQVPANQIPKVGVVVG